MKGIVIHKWHITHFIKQFVRPVKLWYENEIRQIHNKLFVLKASNADIANAIIDNPRPSQSKWR